MNTNNHPDDLFCSDEIFTAVRNARECILSVRKELQGTAFQILVTCLEHDTGASVRYPAPRSSHAASYAGRGRRRAYRN